MARKKKIETQEELPLYEWDKMQSESIQLYERFCWYRDSIYVMDEDSKSKVVTIDATKRRSYRATADHFGFSVHNIEKLGKKYRWQERCEAYDAHIALMARQENDKQVRKMLNNHALLGAAMVQRAAKRFISLPEDDISAADTIRMADVGVKIERMSRGVSGDDTVIQLTTSPVQPKDKPAATVDVPPVYDLSNLSDEELNSLNAIVGKLVAPADD